MMNRVTAVLFLQASFWGSYRAQLNDFVRVIDLSTCETNEVHIPKLPAIISIHGTVRNPEESQNSTTSSCHVVINVGMYSTEEGLEVRLLTLRQFLQGSNISVFHSRHNRAQNVTLFTGDDLGSTTSSCLTSHDGVVTLQVFYHLTSEVIKAEKLLHLKSVDRCWLNSSTPETGSGQQDIQVPQDDIQISGGGDGPRIGTSIKSETDGHPAKASVDVIIITGVVVAAVIGLAVVGFAIRRWMRNSVAEERRLSQIRVNSHSSHTRSTSPNRRSSQSRSSTDQGMPSRGPGTLYGSVRIGGRLPSSEDESDMFADTKSTKTDIDVV